MALVDTGADLSLCAAPIATGTLRPTTVKTIKGVGGERLGVMGKTSLPILIEEQPHLVECVVVDDCQPSLVLGMDFLLQRGAILDLSKGQMHLRARTSLCVIARAPPWTPTFA